MNPQCDDLNCYDMAVLQCVYRDVIQVRGDFELVFCERRFEGLPFAEA
jgi:hypothetical protein